MHSNYPAQRGLGMVELMVGLAAGALVVAAAGGLAVQHLASHSRLARQAQLDQDLRAAASLVVRELRRAGHWHDSAQALPAPGEAAASSPVGALSLQADGDSAAQLGYSYSREDEGDHGVRQGGLRLSAGALQLLLDGAGWQTVTDVQTLRITQLRFTLHQQDLPLPCALPCPAGDTACPPVQQLRRVQVQLQARAADEPALLRRLDTDVALRNDLVQGRCPV
jgi:type IV pilus assembly protein PilW